MTREEIIRIMTDTESPFVINPMIRINAEKQLEEYEKQIRAEVIEEIGEQVEFEEDWLNSAYEDNGYKYSCTDVDMAFIGIKKFLKRLKEQNK